jgi:hypothetical protein
MSSKTERDDEAIMLVVASLAGALGYYGFTTVFPGIADAFVGNFLTLLTALGMGLAVLFLYDLFRDVAE